MVNTPAPPPSPVRDPCILYSAFAVACASGNQTVVEEQSFPPSVRA